MPNVLNANIGMSVLLPCDEYALKIPSNDLLSEHNSELLDERTWLRSHYIWIINYEQKEYE